jgi:hypothetical protein
MSKTNRRSFLKTATAVGVASGLTASVSEGSHRDRSITVRGTSQTGNVQEALDKAIGNAFEQAPNQSDVMVLYELKSISGRVGGIAGFNDVSVTIKARFS